MGDLDFQPKDSTLTITSSPLIGSPAYAAGLERGDRLVSLGGRATITQADVDAVLGSRQPGATVPAVIIGRDGRRELSVTLAESPEVEIVTYEEAKMPVNDAIRTFRAAWMASKAVGR